MKSLILRIAITFSLLISSNYFFAYSHSSMNSVFQIEQQDQNKFEKEQAVNNPKRNDEAVELLNDKIKNLEADIKHDKDKVEALKAMRDYIKKNRTKDTGTTLYRARKKAKETAKGKDNEEAIKKYIDKTGSAIKKRVFGLLLVAKGTGQTTGHIATINITNNSDNYITLQPELIYISTSSKHQSYVGYVPPDISIAPSVKSVIPIHGYCANPHLPPVPLGESMLDPSKWIPIDKTPTGGFTLDGPPSVPEPMNPPGGSTSPPKSTISIYVSDIPTKPSFDPSMINTMVGSPAYTEDNDDDKDPDIQVTWPGTKEEIGGSFEPTKDPVIFAQVAVEGLIRIIDNVDTIQNSGIYITPFSNDKEKEKEALIQQTFWIFVAGLMGDEYEEEDFTNNIYQQFETATGKSVVTLPPEQKEQIDGGASDFWQVYEAVGLKAKVISVDPKSDE